MNINVLNILSKVYGAKGLPFPHKPSMLANVSTASFDEIPNTQQNITMVNGFEINETIERASKNYLSTDIKKYKDELLGSYEFMPVTINDKPIPNAIIMISGEKEFIETNIIGALDSKGNIIGGTVFEKTFTKPYDITIIATLIQDNVNWPENMFANIVSLWQENKVVTLKSALTDYFLPTTHNALIQKINILDNAGAENVEIVQLDLRSNLEFELVLK